MLLIKKKCFNFKNKSFCKLWNIFLNETNKKKIYFSDCCLLFIQKEKQKKTSIYTLAHTNYIICIYLFMCSAII